MTKSATKNKLPPVSATPSNALRALLNSPCLGDANQRTACIGSFPLLKIFFRVHELVAGSSAWRVRAAKDRAKVGSFAALHGFSYTTRANIAHERAEQIRARIVCTPAEKKRGGRG